MSHPHKIILSATDESGTTNSPKNDNYEKEIRDEQLLIEEILKKNKCYERQVSDSQLDISTLPLTSTSKVARAVVAKTTPQKQMINNPSFYFS